MTSAERLIQKLQGKSIALVGGASSIFDEQYGPNIDAAEVVVRMNRSFPKKPAHQGRRTDLLTTSCDISRWQYWRYYRPAQIMWMSPKIEQVTPWMQRRDLSFYPDAYWQTLSHELSDHRPSTGAMTIDFICNYVQPEKLDLYGFDFKKSKTLYQKKEKLGPHNWEIERQYVLKLVRNSSKNDNNWILHTTNNRIYNE